MMRTSSTTSLLFRDDVIVVASVASIFGLRHPNEYKEQVFYLANGKVIKRKMFLSRLIKLGYQRSDDIYPGNINVKGDTITISPS
jgi:excinuclease ABC subunit B